MMNLIQTTLLVSTVRTATASSFSDLTYGSSPQSASSIIDAILNGGGDAQETTATSSESSSISTIASLNTVVETDFIADAFEGGKHAQQNVCAPSMAEAQSKLCNGESITACQDAMDCSFGEACFLDVACQTTTSSTSSSRDDFEISHFVMLGKDSQGDVMTLANSNMLRTTTPAVEPEPSAIKASLSSNLVPNMSQFSSSSTTTTISSQIESTLEMIQEQIDNELFLYETPLSDWIPSTVYRFSGFFDGFKVMHSVGVAGKKLYLGANSPGEFDFLGNGQVQDANNCGHCFMYGLVNIAAFLAQAMKETIRYDACDENSWDRVGPKEMYPISNSCGQLGQSYQDYHCSEEEKHMECPVDPEMTITAVTHAKWWGAPGPLMCGPKSSIPQTGYWDYAYECNNPWKSPPETCDVYDEQKAGKAMNDEPYPNAAGRTDVEGCCWWGRGVIQTSGVCNFGKLNYYLGKRAFLEGRDSRYPDIDFCRDPEIICKSEEHKELKWIAGFFYWVDQVQPYDTGGWNYLTELKRFVDGGLTGDAFINSVSGIVNRGCHNPPCGTGDLDGGPERAENFFRILKALDFSFVDVEKSPTDAPTPLPTPWPTQKPLVGTASPVSSTISYTCGDGSQSFDSTSYGESSPSIDLTFDYEVHSDLDVAVSQALQEIKQSVLSDLAQRLGCTESSQRRLQVTSGNVVGLLGSRSDMPDPDAAGCLVEVDALEPTACTPIKGEIKVFAEPGSTEADLMNMGDYLKDTIRTSMDSGSYESRTVKRVTWIGDRELYLEELNPSEPAAIQNEPEDSGVNWMKIAIYSLAGVCAFLLCLRCMFRPSTRRKSPTHDEELAMMEYMNAQREHNALREQNYKRRSSAGPQNSIQRRSEHLRAVQQGHPLQVTYASEAGTATSESDDDDSYFQRRNSANKKNSNNAIHHKIVAMPEQAIQRRESARYIANAEQRIQRRESARYTSPPTEPPMIIGEAGHFYVKSNQDPHQEVVEDELEALEALPYQPQSGGGVESEHDDDSSNEEELPPVRPPQRRHSSRGAIEASEAHEQRANVERRPKRETWAAPRSNAHSMSKEERQRRIERARSYRMS
jgi:hypothetical protein